MTIRCPPHTLKKFYQFFTGPSKSTSSKKWWVLYTTFLEGGTFCWDGTLAINMNVLHLISAVELRTAPGSRREVSHNLPLHVTHRTILNSELLIGLNFIWRFSQLVTWVQFHFSMPHSSSSLVQCGPGWFCNYGKKHKLYVNAWSSSTGPGNKSWFGQSWMRANNWLIKHLM